MTAYQIEVAARCEDEYGLVVRADRIETPDRNGMVYCESRYLATAPMVFDGRVWGRSTDVARFKFDSRTFAVTREP